MAHPEKTLFSRFLNSLLGISNQNSATGRKFTMGESNQSQASSGGRFAQRNIILEDLPELGDPAQNPASHRPPCFACAAPEGAHGVETIGV